jgi:hypothetical protein
VEYRGFATSMFVLEMPATRTAPGSRTTLRDSGCGGWTPCVRFVTGRSETYSRPSSTFTS